MVALEPADLLQAKEAARRLMLAKARGTVSATFTKAVLQWQKDALSAAETSAKHGSLLSEFHAVQLRLATDVANAFASGKARTAGDVVDLGIAAASLFGMPSTKLAILPPVNEAPSAMALDYDVVLIFDGSKFSLDSHENRSFVCHEIVHGLPEFGALQLSDHEHDIHAAELVADHLGTAACGPGMTRALASLAVACGHPPGRDSPSHPSLRARAAFVLAHAKGAWPEDIHEVMSKHLKPLSEPLKPYEEPALQRAAKVVKEIHASLGNPLIDSKAIYAHIAGTFSDNSCVIAASQAMEV